MTVTPSIDAARLNRSSWPQASPDLLRELLNIFINTFMSSEVDAVCGAAYGTSSPERTNRRKGYRARDFHTRTGTLGLEIPRLQDTYLSAHLVDVQIGRFVIDQRLDRILPEGESRTEDHVLIPRDYQGLISGRMGQTGCRYQRRVSVRVRQVCRAYGCGRA